MVFYFYSLGILATAAYNHYCIYLYSNSIPLAHGNIFQILFLCLCVPVPLCLLIYLDFYPTFHHEQAQDGSQHTNKRSVKLLNIKI